MPDFYFAYIDESMDDKNLCIFSAVLVPAQGWRATFDGLQRFRDKLAQSDNMLPEVEWHATEFIGGRGQLCLPPYYVTRGRRAEIFRDVLHWIAEMPDIGVVNSLYPLRVGKQVQIPAAFEALVLGLNRVMETRDAYVILIADEGHEAEYRNIVRRLGQEGRINRVLEDTFFKESNQSYFIQLADFCGFALLRRERPTAKTSMFGTDKAFAYLEPALIKQELGIADPEGIIRPGMF